MCVCVCVCFRSRTKQRETRDKEEDKEDKEEYGDARARRCRSTRSSVEREQAVFRLQHAQPEVDVEDVLRVRVSRLFGCNDRSEAISGEGANMDRWTTEELDTFKGRRNDAARAFFRTTDGTEREEID